MGVVGDAVLVLGATGAVRQAAVAALRERGLGVRAATRDPGRSGDDAVCVDFDDPASLRRALEGTSALFLLPPSVAAERQLAIADAALDAAVRARIEHVVTLTGFSAGHDPDSTSRRLEQRTEATGLTWTHLRPNHFMQNYGGLYRRGVLAGEIDLYTGEGRASYIDARDIGAVAGAILGRAEQASQTHVLTGPAALDQHEIAAVLSRVAGRAIRYTARSADDTRRALHAAGLAATTIEIGVARLLEIAEGRFEPVSPAVEAILGRPPRDFERYARDHEELW